MTIYKVSLASYTNAKAFETLNIKCFSLFAKLPSINYKRFGKIKIVILVR